MSNKAIFIRACQEIASQFPEFSPSKKGQHLNRNSQDATLNFEIRFHTSQRNYSGNIVIVPYLTISANKTFQEKLAHYQLINKDIIIYQKSLGYLNPRQEYYEWNLAGASFEISVKHISQQITEYFLPIFRLFDDPTTALQCLLTNGSQFYPHIKERDLSPFYFILAAGTKEQAAQFIQQFIKHCGYQSQFIKTYEQLKTLPLETLSSAHCDINAAQILKEIILNQIEINSSND